MSYEPPIRNQMPSSNGMLDMDFGLFTNPSGVPEMHSNPCIDPQLCESTIGDPCTGFTEDLNFMTQLEAGLGEYAWGWIPMDDDYSNQMALH